MRDKKRFPFYGSVPYMSAADYVKDDDWYYSSSEQATDGTYWDIIENPFTGEYAYTNLEEVGISNDL